MKLATHRKIIQLESELQEAVWRCNCEKKFGAPHAKACTHAQIKFQRFLLLFNQIRTELGDRTSLGTSGHVVKELSRWEDGKEIC